MRNGLRVATAVAGGVLPDPRRHDRVVTLEAKKRQLCDELSTIENGMTGGPALRARLHDLEADALIGKVKPGELEDLRRQVRELDENERKTAIVQLSLRRIDVDIAEALLAAKKELAREVVEGVYAEAAQKLIADLLAARESSTRLYALRAEVEEKFSHQNPSGCLLPGYPTTQLLNVASPWYRLLAAPFCELRGFLRDCHELGLVDESDLGGVWQPQPVPPTPTGTIVVQGVPFIKRWRDGIAEEGSRDKLRLKPDDGGALLNFNGWTEVQTATGSSPMNAAPTLRVGQRVEFKLNVTASGEKSVAWVRCI